MSESNETAKQQDTVQGWYLIQAGCGSNPNSFRYVVKALDMPGALVQFWNWAFTGGIVDNFWRVEIQSVTRADWLDAGQVPSLPKLQTREEIISEVDEMWRDQIVKRFETLTGAKLDWNTGTTTDRLIDQLCRAFNDYWNEFYKKPKV